MFELVDMFCPVYSGFRVDGTPEPIVSCLLRWVPSSEPPDLGAPSTLEPLYSFSSLLNSAAQFNTVVNRGFHRGGMRGSEGYKIAVESGAGLKSGIPDSAYQASDDRHVCDRLWDRNNNTTIYY